jgi:cell division protein FtsB
MMAEHTFDQHEVDEIIQVRLGKQRKGYERQIAELQAERDRLAREVDELRQQQHHQPFGARLRRFLGRA